MKPPVPYDDTLEVPEPDEAETVEGLGEALREVMDTVSADMGHAHRSVHAKSHGFVEATLTVLPDLPPDYAQGLFAAAGTYPAIMRFSTNPGDILDDAISLPRGLALKVLDVAGERLPGSEGETTQDFLMVNGPAFSARTAKAFLGNLKLLAKTTDRLEWAKTALSAVLRGAEAVLEAVGTESGTLKTLGGAPNVHPLGETYFVQTAFRHGDFVAKYQIVPVSPTLTQHTDETVAARGRPDAIREAMNAAMPEGPMEWELRVQLCRDIETMPVEDATVAWSEDESPFVAVARIAADGQPAWSEARSDLVDDAMRFSPWTGLAAHRPLGVINRVRRETYVDSARFRAIFNACPVHEPKTAALPR